MKPLISGKNRLDPMRSATRCPYAAGWTVYVLCVALAVSVSPAADNPNAGQADPNAHTAPRAAGEPNEANLAGRRLGSSQDAQDSPGATDWFIAKNPTTELSRLVWQARITAPQSPPDDQGKDNLQRIIQMIRSIRFQPKEQTPRPLVATTPTKQTEPNLAPAEPKAPNEPPQALPETVNQPGSLSEQTIRILGEHLKHPEKLKNALELAEILYRGNRLAEAAVCYRQALARVYPNQLGSGRDKPWILFQIGNCLREQNPQEALQAYSRLINEHPNSPWTDLAKARSNLITWKQQDRPGMLLKELNKQPAESPPPENYVITKASKSETEQPKSG